MRARHGRALDLALEAAIAAVDKDLPARLPQGLRQAQRLQPALPALVADVDIDRGRLRHAVQRLLQQQHALAAHRKAAGRHRAAAQLLDQAIIAAARQHGALRAQLLRGPLEDAVVVIVQAAHQTRVLDPGDVQRRQPLEHRGVVRTRFLVQAVGQTGRVGQGRLGLRVFRVEHAQRIALDALAAVLVQRIRMRAQPLLQLVTVGGARRGAAQRVDLQRHGPQHAGGLQQVAGDGDDLDIRQRAGGAEILHADLVELPIAAGLRPLVAEHRAGVPEPALRIAQQAAVDAQAHRARGALRAQAHRVLVAVDKGKHLLLDNVRGLAHTAGEELGRLQHRHAHLGVAIAQQHLLHRGLQRQPGRRVGRADIGEAAQRAYAAAHE